MNTNPIIVGGFWRSGTTLLSRLLDSHSNIHCGPEVKFFLDFYGDYLKDELAHTRFFKTIRSLQLEESELISIFGKAFIECHERAVRKLEKCRWADKCPENVLYMDQWYDLLDGKLYFIHMVRNPLDALSSLIDIGFKKIVPKDFKDKVELYKKFVWRGIEFVDKYPEISFLVHYEELVSNPQGVLKNLLGQIGEEYEPSMLEKFTNANRYNGIEDPKAKFKKTIETTSIDRWKQDLKKRQVRYAVKELDPLFKRLGYEY